MCQSADRRREREQAAVDMPQDTLICLAFIKCIEVDAGYLAISINIFTVVGVFARKKFKHVHYCKFGVCVFERSLL